MKRINLTSCVLFTLFALFPLSSWAADGIKVLKSGIKHFGKTVPRCFAAILGISLGFALYTVPAYAGGGNVLPPKANPKGYSLSEIAEATAFFNTNPNRSEAIEPAVPFQILYVSATNPSNTFFVRPGTMLYVPILYVDDSDPIIGDFPTDVTDHAAVVYYYYAHEQLGTEYIEVEVDGKVTQLGPKYVVGVETPPLPDGGGTNYIPAAVFLTPLTKGTHTVKIRARLTGLALVPFFGPDPVYEFEVPYTVIVR